LQDARTLGRIVSEVVVLPRRKPAVVIVAVGLVIPPIAPFARARLGREVAQPPRAAAGRVHGGFGAR
jgi:hypothetical protein